MLPGPRYRELTTMPTLFFVPLTGNEEGNKEPMVLRVRPTPTQFPTNIHHTPLWTTSPSILYKVCDACEASSAYLYQSTTHSGVWTLDHQCSSSIIFISISSYFSWLMCFRSKHVNKELTQQAKCLNASYQTRLLSLYYYLLSRWYIFLRYWIMCIFRIHLIRDYWPRE